MMTLSQFIRFARLPVCLLILASLAWAALTPDQVATRIRNRITKQWTATNLSVKVIPHRNNANADKGHYKQISVTASSVVMSGIKMTSVKLAADDPVLDLNRLARTNDVVLTKRRSDSMNVMITETELNKALPRKKNTIQNLHVTLQQNCLTFTGTFKYGIGANLKLQGRLETPDGYKINFIATKASVNGVPLPAGPLRTVLSRMNPLIDFHKVPLSPKVDRIIISPGRLQLTG